MLAMESEGWDLQAVVKGCCGPTTAAAAADPFSSFSPLPLQGGWGEQDDLMFCFSDLFATQTEIHELEELWKPFSPASPTHQNQQQQQFVLSPQGSTSSCSAPPQLSARGGGAALVPPPQQLSRQPPRRTPPQTPRSKRRKNQQKKVVCQVPADGHSSDMWAWRKYGQKPIKGSPYPRGYYRCSSSKGCIARKQVERSRTDPAMFVVTFTGEHNHPPPTHRNSLAGSTRQKFPTSTASAPSAAANSAQELNSPGGGRLEHPDCKASPSSPLSSPSAAGLSPTTPLTASPEDELFPPPRRAGKEHRAEEGGEEEEEEDLLLVGDMEMLGEDDVLFLNLQEMHEPDAGASFSDAFSEQYFGAFPTPWIANNTAAATGRS